MSGNAGLTVPTRCLRILTQSPILQVQRWVLQSLVYMDRPKNLATFSQRFVDDFGIPSHDVRAILELCTWHYLAPRQFLFHEEDESEHLFILASGRVRIFRANTPKKTLALETMGSILGELGALDGLRRTASAQAATKAWVASLKITTPWNLPRIVSEFLMKVLVVRYRSAMNREQKCLEQWQLLHAELVAIKSRNERRVALKLRRQGTELMAQNRTDPLTQAWNRKYLEETLSSWGILGKRFSLAILDLDHFKRINDTHGHLAGDRVLTEFTKLLQSQAHRNEKVVRYGGEEFIILFPGASLKHALKRCEAIRASVAANTFHLRTRSSGQITTSIGVASFHESVGEASQIVAAADRALYWAKERGRNQVAAYTENSSKPSPGCSPLSLASSRS
jgi:diguanylate cyclase (GGDEF)-like protein